MLNSKRRVHTISAVLARSIAVCCACLSLACAAQAEDAKPIDVYVTRLDPETVVLAFRSPAPSNRLVVGIARPKETEDSAPSHLYRIPGLREAIPGQGELNNFRTALETPGTPGKYVIHSYPLEDGVTFSFAEIDIHFREYLHGDNNAPAELDVWDVKRPADQPIRVIFLGDLVLIKPTKPSNPVGKTENALILLLTNLAMAEGKHFVDLTLEGGCDIGWNTVDAARRNTLVPETRKNLRLTRSGAIVFSPGTENEYKATNTGWGNRSVHLEFDPVPGFKFKVTSRVGSNPEEEMLGGSKDLELPPCAVAQISVQPLAWYEAFQDPIKFTPKVAILKAEVPDPGLRWNWILGGGVLLIAAGFLLYRIVTRRRRRSGLTAEQWKERMDKSHGVKPRNANIITGDQPLPKKPWWKFGKGGTQSEQPDPNVKTEGKSPQPASPAAASPNVTSPTAAAPAGTSTAPEAPGLSSAQVVTDLLRQYKESNTAQQKLFTSLMDAISKSLKDLEKNSETSQELERLRKERDGLAKSLDNWVEKLKHLESSPEKIAEKWKALGKGILKIRGLWTTTNKKTEGETADTGRILEELYGDVKVLKDHSVEYQIAAEEITDALDPASATNADKITPPKELTTQVQKLRTITNQVFQKFAQLLGVGDSQNFKDQSVASLETRFAGLEQTCDALAILGADVRIYRAHIVSRTLANAGRALREIDRENSQFANLFAGTNMEPATVAQQLLDAANSSEATLNAELVKQEKPMSGQLPKTEDIDKVLIPFVEHLLNSDNPYTALMGMLRLWQVAEAYCRDSDDSLSAEFYKRSQAFRDTCKQLLSDLEQLGVHFDPIRFLSDPEGQTWSFAEEAGVPLIRISSRLMDPIRRKLDMNYAEYKRTVADVNAWGFKCTLAPDLNRPTKLWLWRSASRGSSEQYSL